MSFFTPMGMFVGQGAGGPVANATAFNPGDTNPGETLSNGNRTLAYGTGGGSGRAVTGRASAGANHYYEATLDSLSGGATGGGNAAGIGTSAAVLTLYPGGDTNGYSYGKTGVASNGGASGGTALVAGSRVGVLLKAGKVYYSVNGVWQFGADPIAGTGGQAVTAGTYFPMVGVVNTGVQITLQTTLQYLPSGASPWN